MGVLQLERTTFVTTDACPRKNEKYAQYVQRYTIVYITLKKMLQQQLQMIIFLKSALLKSLTDLNGLMHTQRTSQRESDCIRKGRIAFLTNGVFLWFNGLIGVLKWKNGASEAFQTSCEGLRL